MWTPLAVERESTLDEDVWDPYQEVSEARD